LYHFLKHILGGKRALLAGIIFGTSAFVVGFAHAATFDMLLTTCVSASLFYFFQYLAVAREKKNIFAAYAFCGLGILAKGFVAPAIIFLAGAIFWLFERKTKPKLYLITGALIVAGVAGIWLVPVSIIHGMRFWDDFFFQHHLQRYTTSQFHRSEGFLFYFPILALGMFPWTGAIFCGFRSNRTEKEVKLTRFCAIWFISSFLFFSVSQSKLPGYILPLAPAYAVLCALSLADTWENNKRTRILVCLGVFQVSTALALLWGVGKFQVPHSPVYLMAAVILILFIASASFLFARKASAALLTQALFSVAAILIAVHGIYPKTTWNETSYLVQKILPKLKEHKIAVSNVYDFSLVYYTNGKVELDERGYFIDLRNANDLANYLSNREKGFVITSNDDLPWMRQASFLKILEIVQGPERSIIVLKRK
jgi:4-amino-4-deoxy-L-arabinose transferase-like glycosyltransferase